MVSLPKDSIDISRPTSPLLPTYTDEKIVGQPFQTLSNQPQTNCTRLTRFAKVKERWTGVSVLKRVLIVFFITIFGIHLVGNMVHLGTRVFGRGGRHGHGHHGFDRGDDCERSSFEEFWTLEEPIITSATYTTPSSLDDGLNSLFATASIPIDLTRHLVVRFADGASGVFNVVSSEHTNTVGPSFVVESIYNDEFVGPETKISTTSYAVEITLPSSSSSHNVVLYLPSGAAGVVPPPRITVQGQDVSFSIDESAQSLEFNMIDVKTSTGDITLGRQSIPISAEFISLSSETGDIKGEYNVSRNLELRTVTGSIDVDISIIKPETRHPHHRGNGSFPHPPPHRGHDHHHHHHHGPPHKHGKHGKHEGHDGGKHEEEKLDRSIRKRWFSFGQVDDDDEENISRSSAFTYDMTIEQESDEQEFEIIQQEEFDGEEKETEDEKSIPSPPPPHGDHHPLPPHRGHPPSPPGGPGRRPHRPPHGPPHWPGRPGCPGRRGPPPVVVDITSITGSVKVRYVSHPANVSLISKTFSKTGSIDVTLAEEYQGKFRVGTRVGSVVVANRFDKKVTIDKEIKSPHGAFIQGFVSKHSSNFTTMSLNEVDEVDDVEATWFDVIRKFEEPHGPSHCGPPGPPGHHHRGPQGPHGHPPHERHGRHGGRHHGPPPPGGPGGPRGPRGPHGPHHPPPPPGFGMVLAFTEVSNVTVSL